MAIIFEWDSLETKKRKYRTVDIHRRLSFIKREELLDQLTEELKEEREQLKKELKVVEFELKNKHLYDS
jgi:hypothetical protein